MPSDGLPGWSTGKTSPATATSEANTITVPTSETRPTTTMPDETEPLPVMPGDEPPRRTSKPEPAPVVTRAAATPAEAEPADPGQVLGLLALILVGVAVVASQFPFGRIVAGVIAGVGAVAGLAALAAEGRAKLYGGLAMGFHAIILLVVLLLPTWLNLDPWTTSAPELPRGPVAVEHGSGATRPITATDWLDSSNSSWECRDVRVSVRSAIVAPLELIGPKGAKRLTKEPYVQLTVRMANVGVERHLPLSGWATGQAEGLALTDGAGTALKPATFEDGWAPEPMLPLDRVMPGHAAEVRFVFAAPPAKTDTLRLTLPGSGVGLPTEEIRFQIGWGTGRVAGP
jgi:hypothetical protein